MSEHLLHGLSGYLRLARCLSAQSPTYMEQTIARLQLSNEKIDKKFAKEKRVIISDSPNKYYVVIDGKNKYTTSILPEWANEDTIINVQDTSRSTLLIDKLEKVKSDKNFVTFKQAVDFDEILKNMKLYYADTGESPRKIVFMFLERYTDILIKGNLQVYEVEKDARKWATDGLNFTIGLYAKSFFAGDTLLDVLAIHYLFSLYPGDLHKLLDTSREVLSKRAGKNGENDKKKTLYAIQPEFYFHLSNLSEYAKTIWFVRSAQFILKRGDNLRDIARDSDSFFSFYHHLYLAFIHYRVAQRLLLLIMNNWGETIINEYSVRDYYRHSEEMRVVILSSLSWGAVEHDDRPNILNPEEFLNWLFLVGKANLGLVRDEIYDFESQLIIPKYLASLVVKYFEFEYSEDDSSLAELTHAIDKVENLIPMLAFLGEPNYYSLICEKVTKKLLKIGKSDLAKSFKERASLQKIEQSIDSDKLFARAKELLYQAFSSES